MLTIEKMLEWLQFVLSRCVGKSALDGHSVESLDKDRLTLKHARRSQGGHLRLQRCAFRGRLLLLSMMMMMMSDLHREVQSSPGYLDVRQC